MREEISFALSEPTKITNPISKFLANAGKLDADKASMVTPIFLHWTFKVASDIIVPNSGVNNSYISLAKTLEYSMAEKLMLKRPHQLLLIGSCRGDQ